MRNLIFQESEITMSLSDARKQQRVPRIVPILYFALFAFVLISILLFVERLYMAAVIMVVKALGRKGYKQNKLGAMREKMEQNREHPRVLIQILINNESEGYYYKLSVGAACALVWPQEQLIVQVIDNSTNMAITTNVKEECRKWKNQGINIKYEDGGERNGYYAGGLQEGLKKQYVNDCDYVVILNADFQPEKDFLKKTIPRLIDNKDLGMVLAKWMFVGGDECLWTRHQEINYHFSIKQLVGSSSQFFGLYDIAGEWKIQAIIDAGGWKERITSDEMNLAVRTRRQGWKFVSLGDVC